ncbi:MAG TPA: adenylate/guanylate cyclase domain-containing protein [Acidimicrobiales bacterium]|nr:adenylate/guanylate cyclase domain-containing protein [Acidimicrobiales bacterium]
MPTETLTFLFTDIEGSTALLARLGHEVYAEALAEHHRLVRAALAAHGGREVGTEGDSFFAVFTSASEALKAAIEMQRDLGSHDWANGEELRARMGVHVGEAAETSTGLVGLDVHRAARVAALAHGGQVLVSETAAALLRLSLPPGAGLRDLGLHQLKDIGQREHIFQVEAAGLGATFPPLRSLSNPVLHNLPSQRSSFVGRTRELALVRDRLSSSRLVTLTGPGGTGKTRLALRAAADEVDRRPDGAWFVDLAPLHTSDALLREVASVLGFRDKGGPTSMARLAGALGTRGVLLVLDNCEHLVDPCAELVNYLLEQCPGAAVLATSREPLRVVGEHVVRVPPLGLPAGRTGPEALADVAASEAAVLFVERARAHDDRFVLDGPAATHVISICRRLDGLPLALELAAARLRSMTVAELEARLGNHLQLLSASSRTSVTRQQTMRALVDWSYQMLSPPERSTFRRLSVFAGPFDLVAAVVVSQSEEVDGDAAEEAVFSLVDKSLVQTGTEGAFTRFRVLESIRQFAEEQLGASEEEREEARAHLVRHYADLASRAEAEMFGPNEEMWLERFAEEQPNILAALHYAEDGTGTDDWGLALACSLYDFWLMEDPALGVEVLERILAHGSSAVRPAARAKAMWALAEQCQQMGQSERAIALCTETFPIAVAEGDLVAAAQCRKIAANSHAARGETDREDLLMAEAAELARRSGDPMTLFQVLHDSSLHRMNAGDLDGARVGLEEAVALGEEADAARHVLLARVNLGNLAEATGDLVLARELFSEALGRLKDRRRGLVGPLAGLVSMDLCVLALTQGDLEAALGQLPTVMANSRYHPGFTLYTLALCASAAGNCETASLLHGGADAVRERSGLTGYTSEVGDRHIQADRDSLRANKAIDFDRLYASGRRLSEQKALRLAGDFVSALSPVAEALPVRDIAVWPVE